MFYQARKVSTKTFKNLTLIQTILHKFFSNLFTITEIESYRFQVQINRVHWATGPNIKSPNNHN